MAGGFGLVVNNRKEILLIQRAYGKHKGKWSLPGGHQDKGETLKQTAVRETKEETNIRMSADALYYIRPHKTEVWRGRRLGGSLKIQEKECLDAKWFQKDMLPHHTNLAFGFDKKCLDKWAAENTGSRRVHYPRSKMRRAGFALIVNKQREVLLVQERSGSRKGKWRLVGGVAKGGQTRTDAALTAAYKATGASVAIDSLYYENKHRTKIFLATPKAIAINNPYAKWFPLDGLPSNYDLAFAVDVRTIEKWASENK